MPLQFLGLDREAASSTPRGGLLTACPVLVAGEGGCKLETRRVEAGGRTGYWGGRDDCGESVSSGMYIYELRAGPSRQARRMVIRK